MTKAKPPQFLATPGPRTRVNTLGAFTNFRTAFAPLLNKPAAAAGRQTKRGRPVKQKDIPI